MTIRVNIYRKKNSGGNKYRNKESNRQNRSRPKSAEFIVASFTLIPGQIAHKQRSALRRVNVTRPVGYRTEIFRSSRRGLFV